MQYTILFLISQAFRENILNQNCSNKDSDQDNNKEQYDVLISMFHNKA